MYTDFRAISSNVIAICIGTPVTRRIVHDSEYRNAVPGLPPFKARNVKMAQTTINLGDAFVWWLTLSGGTNTQLQAGVEIVCFSGTLLRPKWKSYWLRKTGKNFKEKVERKKIDGGDPSQGI